MRSAALPGHRRLLFSASQFPLRRHVLKKEFTARLKKSKKLKKTGKKKKNRNEAPVRPHG
jgi:hypothetical protein